jgi:TIR domain
MAGIFINYRRDDAPGVAGRLFDYLALKFPRRSLFMDVDAMKPGMDFAKQLDTQVSQCQVLLAVIGPHWLDAKDQAGQRRLDAEKDYVRIELASALKRAIPVIPILVDGAAMPHEDTLSDDLKPLTRRHALELRHTRFNADADAIMHALESVVPRRSLASLPIGAAVAVAVVAIALVAVLWPKIAAKLHPGVTPPAVVAANPSVPSLPAPNSPAASLPAASLPAASLPAASLPAASLPAAALPAAALPAAPQPTPKQVDTMGNWAGNWAGVWFVRSGKESTVTIAIGGSSIVGTTLWRETDDSESRKHKADGTLFNCKVNGNTANCELAWNYTDPAKDLKNHATGNLALDGDHLTGEFHQDEAEPTWRTTPYLSAMHVGAVWQWDLTRKK